MKLVIASDLHGSATATRELVDRIEEESPDRVALLADGRLCMAGTPEQVYAGGALDRVFGVAVRRMETPEGWQYYCTPLG